MSFDGQQASRDSESQMSGLSLCGQLNSGGYTINTTSNHPIHKITDNNNKYKIINNKVYTATQ